MKKGSLSLIGAMIGSIGLIISSKGLIDILCFSPWLAFIFRVTYVIALGLLFYLSFKLIMLNMRDEDKA